MTAVLAFGKTSSYTSPTVAILSSAICPLLSLLAGPHFHNIALSKLWLRKYMSLCIQGKHRNSTSRGSLVKSQPACQECQLQQQLLMQVLTPADDLHHINKHSFKAPFVCGCRDLGEALRRIAEGAAMIRTKASHSPDTHAHLSSSEHSMMHFQCMFPVSLQNSSMHCCHCCTLKSVRLVQSNNAEVYRLMALWVIVTISMAAGNTEEETNSQNWWFFSLYDSPFSSSRRPL